MISSKFRCRCILWLKFYLLQAQESCVLIEFIYLSQEMIEKLAKNSFEAIGRHLKKSRYADLIQIQTSRIRSLEPEVLETESDDNVFAKVDPALKEPKIDKILKENKRIAEEKLHDVTLFAISYCHRNKFF